MPKNYADIAQSGYLAWLKGSIFLSCQITHAQFLDLINPSNVAGQLILSHLVAIQTLMTTSTPDERGIKKSSQFVHGMVKWLNLIHSRIDPSMRRYFEWPIQRAEEVREWISGERNL